MKQKLLTGFIIFIFFSNTAMAQNVGIGVNSPTAKLHINDSASANTVITLTNTNGGITNQGNISLKNSAATDKALEFYNAYVDAAADTRIFNFLNTGSNPVLSILNNGNTGIGTGAPKNKLDISGGAVIGSGYAGNFTSPANSLLIEGRLGIGVTTPQNKLDVKGNAVIGNNYSGNNGAPANGLLVEGNVGIGTFNPSPANKLEVIGNAAFGGAMSVSGTMSIGGNTFMYGNLSLGGLGNPVNKLEVNGGAVIGSIWVSTPAPAQGLLVQGNVGIGVPNPQNKLDVEGGAAIGSAYSGSNSAPSNGLLVEGNMGLGTPVPKNKLDINGGAVIGSIYAGSAFGPVNGLAVAGNVGLGTSVPRNKLDVAGGAVIGSNYSGINTAPGNGLLVEGAIGIGIVSPLNKLDVNGGAAIGNGMAGFVSAPLNGLVVQGNTGLGTGLPQNKLDVKGNMVIGFDYAGTNSAPANGLLVQGYVGLGISNPIVPLEVGSFTTYGPLSFGFLNASGSTGFATRPSVPVSIKATERILASEFNAYSDVRIKRNITSSTSQNDLATLLKIRVADYQLKDSIYNGNIPIKGFIAQELEKILPQAVHTNADYVPDIYCLSTVTEYNEKEKTLKISLCKPHQLKVGDKVKAFAGDGLQEQYVSAINDGTTFTLSNWEIKQAGMNPVEKVFIWGKWVEDFHTVDYNQVFSLGISAMQQLAKENEDQKKINLSLQQQIDELKKLLLNLSK
jgi:Chaperone of endosialidase